MYDLSKTTSDAPESDSSRTGASSGAIEAAARLLYATDYYGGLQPVTDARADAMIWAEAEEHERRRYRDVAAAVLAAGEPQAPLSPSRETQATLRGVPIYEEDWSDWKPIEARPGHERREAMVGDHIVMQFREVQP